MTQIEISALSDINLNIVLIAQMGHMRVSKHIQVSKVRHEPEVQHGNSNTQTSVRTMVCKMQSVKEVQF